MYFQFTITILPPRLIELIVDFIINIKKAIMWRFLSFVFIAILLSVSCEKPYDPGLSIVIPLAPTNLVATVISSTQINLSWKDNSTNETGFKIERKVGTGNYSVISNGTADITVYRDSGLLANTSYTYRVSSFNSAGPSITYSNEVTVVTNSTNAMTVPILTTRNVTDTTGVSAVSGGNITSDGGSPVTVRGVVWSTSPNPTISLSTKTVDGSGSGNFISNITGLALNTIYYVRAYATNATGTGYGNEVTFQTSSISLNTGLVAWYPFKGSLVDSTNNKYSGTNNGATYSTDRFGVPNNAILFTPSTNFSIPALVQLSNSPTFSISFWRKYTDSISNYVDLINVNNKLIIGTGIAGSPSSDRDTLTFFGNPGGYNATSIKKTDKVWQHVVLNCDGAKNQLSIYIDGILYKTTSLSLAQFPNLISSDRTTISNAGGKNGELDELRFYNRILTNFEINVLSKN